MDGVKPGGQQPTPAWDGRPPNPERSDYHWLRRTDAGCPMPAVIWTWRADAQVWRWRGGEHTPETQAREKEYVAPVTPPDEVDRLRAEVASLRLTLGGRTFSGQPVPDPIGCPMPGACAQVAEIKRLRRGWLRSIQDENSCAATGKPCREPCGCLLEQAALMEADNGK